MHEHETARYNALSNFPREQASQNAAPATKSGRRASPNAALATKSKHLWHQGTNMREPVTMRFPVCFPASCFSALLTTPETWLHTCRKMVLHGFTLIVSQSVLCCPSFSSVTCSQNRAAYAYAIRRRSGHMLCKSSFEGLLLGSTCSDISIKFCSAV